MKKNILFISHRNVYTCEDGGMIDIFYPLKFLASKCNVYFAFPCETITKEMMDSYHNIGITPIPYILNTKDNYLKYPLTLFSELSFKFSKFYNTNFLFNLCNIIETNNIDTVWCCAAQSANYGTELKKRYPNIKIYLREANIEYKLVKQHMYSCNNLFIKLFSFLEYLKTKKYEIKIWKLFNKVYFISDTDLLIASKYNKNFNTDNILYCGMEIPKMNSIVDNDIEENSFIFCGSLKTFQNKNNLKCFIHKIWKPFINRVPNVKLYITGNNDSFLQNKLNMTLDELANLNIINLGYVSNIKETIKSKKYFLSPTLYGSGLRIKVLEGMSLEKVVFVTDIDYTMCHYFKDMENIVHYQTSDDFYRKYVMLSNDEHLQKRISLNAKVLIEQNFNWNNYINIIKDIYQNEE